MVIAAQSVRHETGMVSQNRHGLHPAFFGARKTVSCPPNQSEARMLILVPLMGVPGIPVPPRAAESCADGSAGIAGNE